MDNFKQDKNSGLMVPNQRFGFEGVYDVEHWRGGELIHRQVATNVVMTEGITYMMDASLSGLAAISAWYLAIFEANYTPVIGDTAATIVASATESTAYDEATREAWVEAGVAAMVIDNYASKAEFTMNATKTIYGAFLTSASAKSSVAGTLISGALFATARPVIAADVLTVGYRITGQDV